MPNKQTLQQEVSVESAEQDLKSYLGYRCLKDENFKQQLLKDPKATVEKLCNCQLPKNAKIKVLEETKNDMYIVIPYTSDPEEMSDEDLKVIAGGGNGADTVDDVTNILKGLGGGIQSVTGKEGLIGGAVSGVTEAIGTVGSGIANIVRRFE